ncbi:hypothetical protein J2X66_002860 [Pseudomonas sp. 3296]|nr:hypothetical protein [Pseudomonas sp. 3296]
MPLKKISGTAIPVGLGSLALAGSAFAAVPAAAAGTVAAALVGLVALVTPSNLGDSSLYTEDQLRALKQARTRVRLRVEQQTDGSLKGTVSTPAKIAIGKWLMSCSSHCVAASRWLTWVTALN